MTTLWCLIRRAGKLAWAGVFIAWILRTWGNHLPLEKIGETENLQAFIHPQPSYPIHILIVPKPAIRSLTEVDQSQLGLFEDLVLLTQDLVAKYNLEARGYRLIVNGGPYQEIPQLHFHLVSNFALE